MLKEWKKKDRAGGRNRRGKERINVVQGRRAGRKRLYPEASGSLHPVRLPGGVRIRGIAAA